MLSKIKLAFLSSLSLLIALIAHSNGFSFPESPGIKWKIEEIFVSGFPVVGERNGEEVIYTSSLDGCVYAIDAKGDILWSFAVGSLTPSAPVISQDGTIYLTTKNGSLYALEPTGKLKWKIKLGDEGIYSQPILGKDGTLYICGGFQDIHHGVLYSISPEGKLKWKKFVDEAILSNPAIVDDTILFVTAGGYFYKISREGNPVGKFKIGSSILSAPSVWDDKILISSPNGYIFAFNIQGNLLWKLKVVAPYSVYVKGRLLLVISYFGDLYAISPDGNIAWKFQTGQMGCGGIALSDEGVIYLSQGRKLFTLTTNGKLIKTVDFGIDASLTPPAIGKKAIYIGTSFLCAIELDKDF